MISKRPKTTILVLSDGDEVGGVANWPYGSYFTVADGEWNDIEAGSVSVHELGHQLGLNADYLYADSSFTPIDDDLYPSCMRYGAKPTDKGYIDYSSLSGIIEVWEWYDSDGNGVRDSWRLVTLNTNDWANIDLGRFSS